MAEGVLQVDEAKLDPVPLHKLTSPSALISALLQQFMFSCFHDSETRPDVLGPSARQCAP